MISWKYSIEKINGELELAKKKRQALSKLFEEEKVSQHTYDSFNSEIAEAIAEIEARQSALVEKMKSKIAELEQQMKTLEFLLVNSEIRHVSEEIEEETYDHEYRVLSLGLETTKKELDEIRDAISNISGQDLDVHSPPQPQEDQTRQIEAESEEPEVVMDAEPPTGQIDADTEELKVEVDEEFKTAEAATEDQINFDEQTGLEESLSSEQEESMEPLVEEVEETFQSEETPLSEESEADPEVSNEESFPEATLEEEKTEEE